MKPTVAPPPSNSTNDTSVEASAGGGLTRMSRADRLAGLSLPRQVALLAVWPFLELLLNALVGLVDTALAGRISEVALDAIGVAAYIGWLVGLLHGAVGTGAAALIARSVGANKRNMADAALGQALLLAAVWGFVTAGLVALMAPWIAQLFRLSPDTSVLVVTYLRILSLGAGLGAVMIVGNAALRAAGDTRTPFVTMIVVNVVNVGVSVLLTFGPAPWGGHGVAGIAVGTAVAWAVGAVLVLGVLMRGRAPLTLYRRRLKPRWVVARRIVKVGLPSLVENSGMWIGNAIIGGMVGTLMLQSGMDGLMGAHVIGIRIESLSFLPGVAVGIAAATLAGQHLGRGDAKRAAQAIHLCWAVAATLMGLMGFVFFFAPEGLARLMAPGDDMAAVRASAVPLLKICGPIQVFFATYLVLSQALRGAGDTKGPMVMTYLSTFLVRLPLAWLLAFPLGYGLTGMWFGLCGELIVRGLLYAWHFQRGRWKAVKV